MKPTLRNYFHSAAEATSITVLLKLNTETCVLPENRKDTDIIYQSKLTRNSALDLLTK